MKKKLSNELSQRDDVFQVSLTELAFTIIFLILVLVGLTIKKSDDEIDVLNSKFKQALTERDEATTKAEKLSSATELLSTVSTKQELVEKLLSEVKELVNESKKFPNEDDSELLFKKLIEKVEVQAQVNEYKKKIDELDKELSNLQEIKTLVNQAENNNDSQSINRDKAVSKIKSSLLFRQEIENKVGEKFLDSTIQESANTIASKVTEFNRLQSDKDSSASLSKENIDLKGQVAWLQNKLNARGGRDYPPCWAEKVLGKPQYLFKIKIHNDGLEITPAWPQEREHDASELPGISNLLDHSIHSISSFRELVAPIHHSSVQKNCRHYVKLANLVDSLQTFNKYRFAVEEFFYKYEIR